MHALADCPSESTLLLTGFESDFPATRAGDFEKLYLSILVTTALCTSGLSLFLRVLLADTELRRLLKCLGSPRWGFEKVYLSMEATTTSGLDDSTPVELSDGVSAPLTAR